MIKTGIKESRQHFTEYLAKVEKGEEIIITKRNEPIAGISSLQTREGGALASRKALKASIRVKGRSVRSRDRIKKTGEALNALRIR